VTEEPRLDVLHAERLAEQRIFAKVDLPDGQKIRGANIRVDSGKLGGGECRHDDPLPVVMRGQKSKGRAIDANCAPRANPLNRPNWARDDRGTQAGLPAAVPAHPLRNWSSSRLFVAKM
jgi:hypothetical protein